MPVDLASLILDVPDFPKPGVGFKDITPLMASPEGLATAIDQLVLAAPDSVDLVLGVESRGFIFAAPVAYGLEAGFVPVRKPGKLPAETVHRTYELEYGSDRIEMHRDAIASGENVLIVDDLIATGGTALATAGMVEGLGGKVVGFGFVIELEFLPGREKLAGYEVRSLIRY